MAAVAEAKQMDPNGFSVEVTMAAAVAGADGASLHSEVRLSEGYSRREVQILYNAARSCEVHHLLRGPIAFDERLVIESDPAV